MYITHVLWCGHFVFFGVDIFRSCCRTGMKIKNFHTRDEIFPHQKRNMSTPVWKVFVHAELGRAVFLLEPKEHYLYIVQYGSLMVWRGTPLVLWSEGGGFSIGVKDFQTLKEIIGAKHLHTYLVLIVILLFGRGNCSLLLGECVWPRSKGAQAVPSETDMLKCSQTTNIRRECVVWKETISREFLLSPPPFSWDSFHRMSLIRKYYFLPRKPPYLQTQVCHSFRESEWKRKIIKLNFFCRKLSF